MMGKVLQFFTDIFRHHKLKIITTLLSALFFFVLLFPYDDLSEVVGSTVSEKTNNQVFLQFDKLGFQFFPHPALAFENVDVESTLFPSLQATHLSVAPSLRSLLTFKQGFTADASGLWDG